jgi:hypothetical protein
MKKHKYEFDQKIRSSNFDYWKLNLMFGTKTSNEF